MLDNNLFLLLIAHDTFQTQLWLAFVQLIVSAGIRSLALKYLFREEDEEEERSVLTCITRIGKPVSFANCSLMCRVGLGVWLNAVFNTSNCLALIVVRGPRRFEPPPSSGLLFSDCESPRASASPSIEPCESMVCRR